jgi:glycosyltransferase involved in cell wall biosynthesis
MITLISTVLNEGDNIRRLMDSLVAQTCPPDEVVIVDGGSHDQTAEILQSYADRLPLRVLVEPGCNISAGRNRAIAAAQGDIIAVTDAGTVLGAHWLEHLTRPLRENPSAQAVGGFFQAEPHTLFEVAMGATVLPLADEIRPETFLPSSRSVAFRKSAWTAVGGYPEWIDYCEDLIFDLRLKKVISTLHPRRNRTTVALPSPTQAGRGGEQQGAAFVFEPTALVYFRPRRSLRSFFKQYYFYARGDGKADLWRKRHAIRYLTYLMAAPLVALLGAWIHPLLWLLYLPGVAVYLYQPYRRLGKLSGQRPNRRLGTAVSSQQKPDAASFSPPYVWGGAGGGVFYIALLIPVIRVVGDFAKMIGYPVGVVWRLRNHPADWRKL